MRKTGTLQWHSVWLTVVVAIVAAFPSSASSQLRVRVIDASSRNPVPLAAVQTTSVAGQVLETRSTSLDGVAILSALPDAHAVRVNALGYADAVIEIDGVTELDVLLEPVPIRIDSLAVIVESTRSLPGRLQFTQRRSDHRGIFLDPFDVGIKSKYGVVEVFRELEGIRRVGWGGSRIMPRIVSNLGSGCFNYRINNQRVRNGSWNQWPLSSLLPKDVMAVEIYRYMGEVPQELLRDASPPTGRSCGLILIWTKEAW